MSFCDRTPALAAAILAGYSSLCAAGPPEQPVAEQITAVRDAHAANFVRFGRMTLRTTKTNFPALSPADGLAGVMMKGTDRPKTGAELLWLYKDGKCLLRIVAEDKPAAEPETQTRPVEGVPGVKMGKSYAFSDEQFMADREYALRVGGKGGGRPDIVGVRGGGKPHRRSHLFFGCGDQERCSEPVDALVQGLKDGRSEYVLSRITEDGREMLKIAAKLAEPRRDLEVTVDPKKGFTYRKVVSHYVSSDPSTDAISEIHFPDTREVNGAWFPWRVVQLMKFPAYKKYPPWCDVFETNVQSLDVTSDPDFKAHAIRIPAGTEVFDDDYRPKYYMTSGAETIDFADLPKMLELTGETAKRKAAGTTAPEPRLHPPGRTRSYYWLLLLPAAAAGWLLLRRWRRRAGF